MAGVSLPIKNSEVIFLLEIAPVYEKYRDMIVIQGVTMLIFFASNFILFEIDGSSMEDILGDAEMLGELGITDREHKMVITKKVRKLFGKVTIS